jgi:hypothetical protein
MKDKKVVFISMPMKDKSHIDMIGTRERVLMKVCEQIGAVLPIQSINNNHGLLTREELLLWSLDLITKADIVVFAKGWKEASGCRLEHAFAVETDKAILYE